MTRINVVPPDELVRQHLIAEYRELPRVFKLAERSHAAGNSPPNVPTYRLGPGHVRFFYDRLGFLRQRHAALCAELLARGYSFNIDCSESAIGLPAEWQRDYQPTPEALAINRARIQERMPAEYL